MTYFITIDPVLDSGEAMYSLFPEEALIVMYEAAVARGDFSWATDYSFEDWLDSWIVVNWASKVESLADLNFLFAPNLQNCEPKLRDYVHG